MPIHYIVLDEGSLVYACASGVLTEEDLLAHEKRVLADTAVTPGYKQLLDCRWVKEDTIDRGVVAVLAGLHAQHRARLTGSRYAIVTHSASWFEVGSAYACDQYGMTMIVFNDPNTACIWLGVDYRDVAEYGWLDVYVPAPQRLWAVGVSTV